jgi:excisionase family DNA binding protein
MEQLMTVQNLADYLQVTPKTVYRLLEHGSLPATRVGHLWRFDKDEIDAWLRQTSKTATAHILVIDDDKTIGSLFQEALSDTGYEIDVTQDSSRGLEIVENGNYDLVFLDLVMPGVDGAAVFERIRKIKPELPVTINTGYPDSELMARVMAIGPFGVIKKPFTGSDIMTAVHNYLRFGIAPR